VELSSFLRVDENKTELFRFLSGILHNSFQLADKELFVVEGDDVLSKPLLVYNSALAPCNHEEADSDIMLIVHHKDSLKSDFIRSLHRLDFNLLLT